MKLSTIFTVATVAQAQKRPTKPDMSKIKAAIAEINAGARTDGNGLLIQQQLEFYLSAAGESLDQAPKLLSYGCWCQILTNRRNGLGDPLDVIDEICKRYQACSKCVAIDNEGELTAQGEVCSWSTARYEIAFDADSSRFGCDDKSTKSECGRGQCQCDTELSFELVENIDEFNKKLSQQHGFEFDDECVPATSPTGSGPGVETTLECCGDYPARIPFKSSEKRQCCKDKVYATSKNCCKKDALVPIAEC